MEEDEWMREMKKGLKEVEERHVGATKLSQMMKREFVWGGMNKDIAEVINKCERCRLSNSRKKFIPELVPRVVREPLELVAIDLLDFGSGLRGTRMQLRMRKTYEEVNRRMEIEREKMKRVYDERNKNRKSEEPKEGDRVYVQVEKQGEKNPKYSIDTGDLLHWNTECHQEGCGQKELGELWRDTPEEWHGVKIKSAFEMAIVASVMRREGKGVRVRVLKEELEKQEMAHIKDEDLREGFKRGLCRHGDAILQGGELRHHILSEDIPPRLYRAYREILGEKEEEKAIFGAFV
ncbi:hypothetical protein PMAYCL1PPCAC_18385, partial [Pristionchus mayeri]